MIDQNPHRGRPMGAVARAPRRRPIGAARALTAALVAALVAAMLSQSATAQTQAPAEPQPKTEAPAAPSTDPQVERIKDWATQCTTPAPDKPRVCFLIHDVFAAENNQRVLQLVIGRFGNDDILGALIFVPLGIRLPPGISLQIDKNAPLQIELERCTQKGCQAQIVLSDTVLASLKAGVGGEVTFEDGAGRPVAVAFSLKGFTAAFAKLGQP